MACGHTWRPGSSRFEPCTSKVFSCDLFCFILKSSIYLYPLFWRDVIYATSFTFLMMSPFSFCLLMMSPVLFLFLSNVICRMFSFIIPLFYSDLFSFLSSGSVLMSNIITWPILSWCICIIILPCLCSNVPWSIIMVIIKIILFWRAALWCHLFCSDIIFSDLF